MKLVIIRHGEPDYEIDGLTEKGKVEADLLAERLAGFHMDEIYVSPLGRARETAEPTLTKCGRSAT
ncbi:MAG: histidine phosphatase family protein, partial [Lachnospiraceae bacterium]|nr:histidine phosphatase family protein [Lachnospiraceae bacterium]